MSDVRTPAVGQLLPTPFDSIRDYVGALDARGRVLHVPAMDQDKYEVTAFAYRLIDKFGIEQAPAFMVDRIKINNEWVEGPLLANAYGRWPDEAVLLACLISPKTTNRCITRSCARWKKD